MVGKAGGGLSEMATYQSVTNEWRPPASERAAE